MGLKFIKLFIPSLTWRVLKSDHFGIEMLVYDELMNPELRLKSDHFGIEIELEDVDYSPMDELKSDHFGIEMKKSGGKQ